MIKILFIGDIVARVGRRLVKKLLPDLIKKHQIDFVIANGENTTHGRGLTFHHYQELKQAGIDVITLGNHYDDRDEIRTFLDGGSDVIRPLNLTRDYPGVGSAVFDNGEVRIRVTNILGMAFMDEIVENPFVSLDRLLRDCPLDEIHIVDFHAEATAEKKAFAYAFDGRVSAIIGTHTHIQTRDAQILKKGTAYITDVGMTGPEPSVLGVKPDIIIKRFWHGEQKFFDYDNKASGVFSGVILTFDKHTTQAIKITPLYLLENPAHE
ncbi:MAG: TIGR00282 family metallophosphoesterase [Bacilli bacterium]|jgi:metallophosphoesterase (TIGR00282 family)